MGKVVGAVETSGAPLAAAAAPAQPGRSGSDSLGIDAMSIRKYLQECSRYRLASLRAAAAAPHGNDWDAAMLAAAACALSRWPPRAAAERCSSHP